MSWGVDGSAFGGIMAWDCLPFEDKGLFHLTKQWEAQQAYQVSVELRNRRAYSVARVVTQRHSESEADTRSTRA